MVTGGSVQASTRAAMNCFFPMPYSRHARVAIRNDGKETAALYFYVDYESTIHCPGSAAIPRALGARESHAPSVEIKERNITMAQVGK